MSDHFEIRDDAFFDVFSEQAQLRVEAEGFTFTEGPIWHPDDHFLIFSDIAESVQYRFTANGQLETFRTPSNQTNGNCFDLAGQVISCEHASSQVVRHVHGGKMIEVIASHYESRALNSPNDVVVDQKGRIWFTDPNFGRTREDLGILRDCELDLCGVYRLDPDGKLTLVADDFTAPNGLCLSLDESQIFINDSAKGHIRVFDIDASGALASGQIWAEVTGTHTDPKTGLKWVPDGMKFANSGHLFCNGPGGVHVFDKKAKCLGVVLFPEKSTNFCFGGIKRDRLFITASTRLYSIPTKLTGPRMIPASN